MNVKLRYILGTPFCGSTALGLMLASGGAHYAGEIDRLPALSSNTFPLSGHFCERCFNLERDCPIYSIEKVHRYCRNGIGTELYAAIGEISNHEIIIDGSKNADWLRLSFSSVDDVMRDNTRAIVCVRNPFQFYRSFRSENPNLTLEKIGEFWRDSYFDIIKTLSVFQIPYVIVRNEDLIEKPARVIASVGAFCGIDVEVLQSYDISDSHTIGGNPSFFKSTSGSGMLALNERKSVTEGLSQVEVASLLNVPGLFSLANDVFGYSLYHLPIGQFSR